MRLSRVYLSEALGDFGAALGFAALSLTLARTGDAWLVALLSAAGYLTLVPILLLSPLLDRRSTVRVLLFARLSRALGWLPLLLLLLLPDPNPILLVLWAYLIMVATDIAVVAWDALLVRLERANLVANTGRLYAAWSLGDLLGRPLGPLLLVLGLGLPYLGATMALVLGYALLRPWARGLREAGGQPPAAGVTAGLSSVLLDLFRNHTLRPYLLLSLLFSGFHTLATGLFSLLVLRAGTPEALFGVFLALFGLGGIAGSYLAARFSAVAALWGGPVVLLLGGAPPSRNALLGRHGRGVPLQPGHHSHGGSPEVPSELAPT